MERKICQRISIGTRTFNEGGADEEHLIAIHEVKGDDGNNARCVLTPSGFRHLDLTHLNSKFNPVLEQSGRPLGPEFDKPVAHTLFPKP